MLDDPRASLRRADDLARQGKYAEAIAIYQAVAEHYAAAGFALKAIAISRSVVQIVDISAAELQGARLIALKRLVALIRNWA